MHGLWWCCGARSLWVQLAMGPAGYGAAALPPFVASKAMLRRRSQVIWAVLLRELLHALSTSEVGWVWGGAGAGAQGAQRCRQCMSLS